MNRLIIPALISIVLDNIDYYSQTNQYRIEMKIIDVIKYPSNIQCILATTYTLDINQL